MKIRHASAFFSLQSWIRRFLTLAVTTLLVSCADTYNPIDHYDPAAVKKSGRIEAKSISRMEERPWADSMEPHHRGFPVPIPIGNQQVTVLFLGGTTRGKSGIPIYGYRIQTSQGEHLLVYSEFPGHEVGECVAIFLSSRPDYPRMAHGGDCDTKPTAQP